MVGKYFDILNRLGVAHECDGQTDGQIDREEDRRLQQRGVRTALKTASKVDLTHLLMSDLCLAKRNIFEEATVFCTLIN